MLNNLSNSKEKINKALGECIAWLTSLNLFKEESYSLKTTLSKVLDNNTADKDLIADAEHFQTLIIERDEYIKDISIDVKKQQSKLKELFLKNLLTNKDWQKEQQKLRNEIAYLERDLRKMREDFYKKFLNEPHY